MALQGVWVGSQEKNSYISIFYIFLIIFLIKDKIATISEIEDFLKIQFDSQLKGLNKMIAKGKFYCY